MRILYVLNAVGGGASAGIYEMLRAQPPITPYAVIPQGSSSDSIRHLFAAVRAVPLPWWNLQGDPLRRLAIRAAEQRRGITETNSVRAIAALIREWDIDLVHTGTALNRGGALAAQQTGTPHLWHIKEGIGRANRVQFPLRDAELVAYISGLSARVIVMSDYVGGIFRQHHCPNLDVVPDGVDLRPYLSGDSRDLRARLNLTPGNFLVGMVAGLSSTWKRHALFVEMAARLAAQDARIHCVIVGGMPPPARFPYDLPRRYAESVVKLAAQIVPARRLTFLEHVPNPPDIMRSLDVLVHPCEIEPFGRIAIEAMAAGTPVVGAAAGGIAETVIDDKTGLLVPPNDPAALAAAVLALLGDAARRARMGQAGRQHVQQQYSIDRFVAQMMNLYRAALEKR